MRRRRDILIVLVLEAFTITYFLLQISGNWNTINLLNQVQTAIVNIVFCLIALISLVVLLFSKAGEAYYENLKPIHLAYIAGTAGLMYAVGIISAAILPASEMPLEFVPIQSSFTTELLSTILFTFTVVALAEELLKFAGYTEFKKRYASKGRFIMWLLALTPIFLWAGYHGIQSYNNLWYLIPAFVNGLLLLALLEAVHVFLAPVLAHGLYNSIVIIMGYVANPSALPLFPQTFGTSDFFLIFLWFLWIVLVYLPILLEHRKG